MIIHVTDVEPCGEYSLRLTFDDGSCKRVNLKPLLEGPVFDPLLRPELFARVVIDPVGCTIVWPNGADIAPETLHGLPDEDEALETSATAAV